MSAKIQLRPYDGRSSAVDWAFHVRQALPLLAVQDAHFSEPDFAVRFLQTRLTGDAEHWLQLLINRQGGPVPFDTIDILLQSLINQFSPPGATEDARDTLDACHQTGPVTQYISNFRAIALRVRNLNIDEEGRHIFIRGLKPALQAEVKVHLPQTLADAMAIALAADRAIWGRECARRAGPSSAAARGYNAPRYPHPSSNPVAAAHHPQPMELGAAAVTTNCYICGGSGHCWKQCMNKRAHPCRKCGRVGHPAQFCRARNGGGR
jgi:hypothetical protein